MTKELITFGNKTLTVEDIVNLANKNKCVELCNSPGFRKKIQAGADFLDEVLLDDGVIYGVTTGYGDSCTVPVDLPLVDELPIHLSRFHGCGLGKHFDQQTTRAILATRLCSLSKGYSGVSFALLERLVLMLNEDVLPLIPEEGSVGASGDLTPLSYIARALIGEADVLFQGELMSGAEAFDKLDVKPYTLRPKEALALMNGTAAMTAIACLNWSRAEYLTRLSSKITSLSCYALGGNPEHFDERLFDVKPHSGQQKVAEWIRSDLGAVEEKRNSNRLQDRYSIRCAPHVIGSLRDALPWLKETIENELNSSNDNPIIDPESRRVLHGGHFYGGHIAMAMDTLKTQVANLADLHDRQMALLMDQKVNNGLPANLSGAKAERQPINHGFKAIQIGCSAWAAEALKLTMPASAFSRSTECHNQDKVSMGTIAARDCVRILELTEQVVVSSLLAASQGARLRSEMNQEQLPLAISKMVEDVGRDFEFLEEDRALEKELRFWLAEVREKRWDLYSSR
ncbi:histidine ammonia-lyase [Idiomarina sp. WRN-38]|uniref:HAL/PAL/TAL family ammonia-lyase n=1 Tax=Idiomarina sp. OXR-189 TaxID=3100175 RepID=UPI0007338364|nr:aromatic amino acid ammonia-lyase [Idiomarina sp. OXR-189]KTG28822.1 histidine ammonia-lyase [Idiomarina sp. H105]OAF09587.1 histidine ammonia-lyase [Idiomarina sp. WRN-38]WPZ01459.1 aromatic amino acid ammonia-lyase [Idiomarina sp. OXR-189]